MLGHNETGSGEFQVRGQTYKISPHLQDYRSESRAHLSNQLIEYAVDAPAVRERQGNRIVIWRYIAGLGCREDDASVDNSIPGRGCYLKVVLGPSTTADFSVITAYGDHGKHEELMEAAGK